MEYKTIEELYLAVGVAGAIIIVFLGLFTYLVIANDKKRTEQINNIIDRIGTLQINDTDFKSLIENLTETVKEVSTTNRIVADTVNRLDYYNKDLHRKLEKHDDKVDRILDEMRK
jgi:methyl-accepting chemotaxis protein